MNQCIKKSKFTKRVKRLNGFGDTTFMKKTNDIAYPVIQTKRNRKRKPYALFSSSGSLGQDFVRHVRNAIAHGRVEVYKSNGSDYLEMTDIGTHGQTAYIAMPVNYLHSLYRIYLEVSGNSQSRQKGKKEAPVAFVVESAQHHAAFAASVFCFHGSCAAWRRSTLAPAMARGRRRSRNHSPSSLQP